jgi:hypothetical protein
MRIAMTSVTLRRGTRIPIITDMCVDSVEDFEEDVPSVFSGLSIAGV